MELIKKNIHMERVRLEASTQIVVNEDFNLSDEKPDIEGIKLWDAKVLVGEVRPGTDLVEVKGSLSYQILYYSKERGGQLVALKGEIPIEETILLTGAASSDKVEITSTVEKLNVGMTNPRKLSISAILELTAKVRELTDVEIPVGITEEEVGEQNVEYRQYPVEFTQLTGSRQEVLPLKGEACIPNGYPNIAEILWTQITLQDPDFKAREGAILLRGQMVVSGLYLAEGEQRSIQPFELSENITEEIPCTGCTATMLPDVRYRLGRQEIVVRPDNDGEDRCITWDLDLEVDLGIYQEEVLQVVADAYGVNGDILVESKEVELKNFLYHLSGKSKLSENIRIPNNGPKILQVLFSNGTLTKDSVQLDETGVTFTGKLLLNVVYISEEDAMPYVSLQTGIPYEYTLEIPDAYKKIDKISIEDIIMKEADAYVEQLQVTLLNGEELDVKAVLGFGVTLFAPVSMELIQDISRSDTDKSERKDLPGMAIYMVKAGDNLWSIGKRYGVLVASIRNYNELSQDTLTPGQKLLIVRGRNGRAS